MSATHTDSLQDAALARIKAESIEEAVSALVKEPLLPGFARLFKIESSNLPDGDSIARELLVDPRVARLARIASDGTEEERRQLVDACEDALGFYVHDMPLEGDSVVKPSPSWRNPMGALALPQLLARSRPDERTARLLLAVAEHDQELAKEDWLKVRARVPEELREAQKQSAVIPPGTDLDNPDFFATDMAMVIAKALDNVLEPLVLSESFLVPLSETQAAAVSDYREWQDDRRIQQESQVRGWLATQQPDGTAASKQARSAGVGEWQPSANSWYPGYRDGFISKKAMEIFGEE